MFSSLWVATKIRLLAKRTSNLLAKLPDVQKEELETVEQEANTCCAMLQRLTEGAKTRRIMSIEDRQIVEKILKDLEAAKKLIEQKRFSWWQRLLRKITELLPLIRELLTILEVYDQSGFAKLALRFIDVGVKLLPPGS
jgi:glutaredoxin 2